MLDYAPACGVVVCAILAALAGDWLGRRQSRWWTAGFFLPLGLILLVGLTRWCYSLAFVEPLHTLLAGRRSFLHVAVGVAMLMATLRRKSPRLTTRQLLTALATMVVAWFGVMPYLYPALVRGQLASLPHRTLPGGVVKQQTSYTCGPAAAATALRLLGLPATEAELAVAAYTNPASGTNVDDLYTAILERYGDHGVAVAYQDFDTLDQLAEAGVVIVTIKHSFMVDHYVVVTAIDAGHVTYADPIRGWRRVTREEFDQLWRGFGLVVTRRDRGEGADGHGLPATAKSSP